MSKLEEKYLGEVGEPIGGRVKPTIKTNPLKGILPRKDRDLLEHAVQFAIDNQQKMGAITPKMAKQLRKIMDKFY